MLKIRSAALGTLTALALCCGTAQAQVVVGQQNFASGLGSRQPAAGSVSASSAGARMTASLFSTAGAINTQGFNSLSLTFYMCGGNDTLAISNCNRDYTNTNNVPAFYTVMANVDHIMAAREALPAMTSWLRWHLAGESSRRDDFLSTSCAFCTGKWSSKSKNW